MLKPPALKPGDTVATVSLSWGGPGAIPIRYQAGKEQFEKAFDLSVIEMPHALRDPNWIAANPKARADDLMAALTDSRIKGIVSSIGGDDSIRLLPFINLEIIRQNPKVFVGYSDTTATHFAFRKAGVVSFYGPAMMSGFAENTGMHSYLEDSFRRAVMDTLAPRELLPNLDGWTEERLDWSIAENQGIRRKLQPATPWQWLQGQGSVDGELIGGCVELIDWLRGTSVWPETEEWGGKILFIETSEEGLSPDGLRRFLRCLGACGVLERCAGLLVGRPAGTKGSQVFPEYDKAALDVVRGELDLEQLPIVTQMDFGHTDPFMTLPIGVQARIDCRAKRIFLLEPAVS